MSESREIILSQIKVQEAVERLRVGEVVAIPTETVYGLAALISSPKGIERIFSVKRRPFFDPLIVHVSDKQQARELTTSWTPICEVLANHFWPGSLTLVLPKRAEVSDLITSGLPTVGIRMPNHPVALELLKELGEPVAAPSANLFKKTSPTQVKHVLREFQNEDVSVIDGGDCKVGIESTVLAVNGSQLNVLRPGSVTGEQIKEALEKAGLSFGFMSLQKHENENGVQSPGQMEDHYMPKKPLIIWTQSWDKNSLKFMTDKLGENTKGVELKLLSDPLLAARNLYSQMHEHSMREDIGFIYCLWPESKNKDGVWTAIWDRLKKSSSYCL